MKNLTTYTSHLPKITIVGRPNVGKSTLFNRIVGKNIATVDNYAGVTRDLLCHRVRLSDKDFLITDTGGILAHFNSRFCEAHEASSRTVFHKNSLQFAVESHVTHAIKESNLIIMLADGLIGPTSLDATILRWLRRKHSDKSVILAINKCDNVANSNLLASSFCELGLDPIPISAINGFSCLDLMYRALDLLPETFCSDDYLRNEAPLTIALVGRPNVGKSSLINTILGKERTIISEIAGTTRDSVSRDLIGVEGRLFNLVDTAGVRKRGAVHSSVDRLEAKSVSLAFKTMKEADVVVLVLDVNDGPTLQDYRISEKIMEDGKACVIAINKCDSIMDRSSLSLTKVKHKTKLQLRPIDWGNIVFTSAKLGQGVKDLMQAVVEADIERKRRLTTATLNHILLDVKMYLSSVSVGAIRTRAKIYFGAQVATCPPTFILFVNDVKIFSKEHKKKIEKLMRENIGFNGTPISLLWRGKTNGLISRVRRKK